MELDGDQHSRHRTVVDEKRRAELLAEYKTSGLSQREYVRKKGIDYNTFGAWLWQQQHRPAGPLPTVQLPAGPQIPPRQQQFRAAGPSVQAPQIEGPATAQLEVSLPGKIVVRGNDPSAVANLVHALRKAGVADCSGKR